MVGDGVCEVLDEEGLGFDHGFEGFAGGAVFHEVAGFEDVAVPLYSPDGVEGDAAVQGAVESADVDHELVGDLCAGAQGQGGDAAHGEGVADDAGDALGETFAPAFEVMDGDVHAVVVAQDDLLSYEVSGQGDGQHADAGLFGDGAWRQGGGEDEVAHVR